MLDEQGEKRRPITTAQWVAARAVSEGAPATRTQVAALLGCDVGAVYQRAMAEGWTRLDFRTSLAREAHRAFIERVAAQGVVGGLVDGDGDPATAVAGEEDGLAVAAGTDGGPQENGDAPFTLIARAAKVMARRLADLVARAEAGGRLNKAEIDGLLALARMMERWETLAKERAKEEEAQSDEDIARTLRIIDRRIVELAHGEAARLVARDPETGDGPAGSG